MSSLAVSAPTVNHTAHLVPSVSIPFTFGEQDARQSLPCVPEMYWTHIDDQRDYCAGYRTIAGETVTTRLFLGAVGKISNGHTKIRASPMLAGALSEADAEIFLSDLFSPASRQLPFPAGSLQGMIDHGAEVLERQDDMADREFWSSGQW
jgi:hypothetical protein